MPRAFVSHEHLPPPLLGAEIGAATPHGKAARRHRGAKRRDDTARQNGATTPRGKAARQYRTAIERTPPAPDRVESLPPPDARDG
ncbi:MAG: hypothetical protein KC983_00165 [Phycisphaerales bacterium]|nr:hypothetical protein [Phycisphaerales bacterium]